MKWWVKSGGIAFISVEAVTRRCGWVLGSGWMCGVGGSGGEHKLGLALWGLARWGHAAAESGLLTAFNVWI